MSKFHFCPLCSASLVEMDRDGLLRLVCESSDCDYVHWNNPTPVVAGIVQQGNEVILVRNKGWPETWYGLVTGFLEAGESPEQGIVREVKEELDLESEVRSLVGLYPFYQMNQLIIAYHVFAVGEVSLGDELADHRRVVIEKLKPWPFATGDAVRDWLSARPVAD